MNCYRLLVTFLLIGFVMVWAWGDAEHVESKSFIVTLLLTRVMMMIMLLLLLLLL